MTTDGSEYLVRCFAYSMSGQRCEQLAGHEGNHAVVTEWRDDECFVPGGGHVPAAPAARPDPTLGQDDPPDEMSAECLICDHPMHRGMCREQDCDCKNGLPK